MEKIIKAWNWIKEHERLQGIAITIFIEFIILMVIWSIKCGL